LPEFISLLYFCKLFEKRKGILSSWAECAAPAQPTWGSRPALLSLPPPHCPAGPAHSRSRPSAVGHLCGPHLLEMPSPNTPPPLTHVRCRRWQSTAVMPRCVALLPTAAMLEPVPPTHSTVAALYPLVPLCPTQALPTIAAPPTMHRAEGSMTSCAVHTPSSYRLASLLVPSSPVVSCMGALPPFHRGAASSLHLSSATRTTTPRQNLHRAASHGTCCRCLHRYALPPRMCAPCVHAKPYSHMCNHAPNHPITLSSCACL
jgi:hypothetical protein